MVQKYGKVVTFETRPMFGAKFEALTNGRIGVRRDQRAKRLAGRRNPEITFYEDHFQKSSRFKRIIRAISHIIRHTTLTVRTRPIPARRRTYKLRKLRFTAARTF